MAKIPKKGAVGTTTVYQGVELVVQVTGQYNGQDQTSWVIKETGEKAFKKVNGDFIFVGTGEAQSARPSAPKVEPVWGDVDEEFLAGIQESVDLEDKYTAVAANIARERYPGMDETSSVFGQITNAIKTHLIQLR